MDQLSSSTHEETTEFDPLDIIEVTARRSDGEAQRIDDSELHIGLNGMWKDISLWFAWRAEAQVLQVGVPIEMRFREDRLGEVLKLLAIANEQLWLGHFDLWEQDKGLVFRHAIILPEGQVMDESQAEILLRGAQEAVDRFYPAFNYVIWGGKTAEEAVEASVVETAGSA